ncbi:Signal peptidase I [Streptomyces sp. YIM 130001]|uniref:signal peptidase I n=1 Tax=Streptomyces sp. YIM 130001 TaxID=2259644 RepID=UPI000E65E3A4|nr:signal peptidase I [Streptomyces sp. YIM 130001]RII09579.1 Signal peptidase I [Streptomyces sp. YIM 130001]
MGSRGRPRNARRADNRLPTGTRPTSDPIRPGRAERRRLAKKVKRRRRRSAVKEIPLLIGVALLIALGLKTFLVQAFVIPSGSMEQTIKIGDRVLVDKLTPWFGSKPQRGDVVVFKDPGGWLQKEQNTRDKDDPVIVKQLKEGLGFIGLLPSEDEQDLIKRVVAVGGDRVKCCGEDGRVTVNGTPISEPYLNPGDRPSMTKFDVTVPKGRLFVMGDHRSNSADSRAHMDQGHDGTVSEDGVVGRAVVTAWPFDHWRTLEERETYASVPDPQNAGGVRTAADGPSHRLASENLNARPHLPTPAELPLVMGVVGLHHVWGRQRYVSRSGCGGFGRRRTIRTRGTRRRSRCARGDRWWRFGRQQRVGWRLRRRRFRE